MFREGRIIMWGKSLVFFSLIYTVGLSAGPAPVQLVTEWGDSCVEVTFKRPVALFKDPNIETEEADYNDLISTTFEGKVLLKAGRERPVRNLRYLRRLEEQRGLRFFKSPGTGDNDYLLGIPVQICGNYQGYPGAMGFILKSDWDEAIKASDPVAGSSLPPSTPGNPVPRWTGRQAEVTTPLF